MKTETRTIYIARDGKECATEAQCRAHERRTCGSALIGLTEAQVEAARTRTDLELAEAIEAFGYELRKARRASGVLKRRGGYQPQPGDMPPVPTTGSGVKPASRKKAGDNPPPPLREALEADSPAGTEPEPAEARE
jgi:hypothetical protein